jgi:hypothetical protein
MFTALTVDGEGNREISASLLVVPGQSNLFQDIRQLGDGAGLGRYRKLDLSIDSPTWGYHLFEHGIVKISNVHI